MKKIFTILLAVGSVGFASAQSGSHNYNSGRDDWNDYKDVVHGQSSRDVYRSNTSNYDGYAYRGRENDERSQRDNREFSQGNFGIQRGHHFVYNERSRQTGMFERQREGQFREENSH